MNGGTCIERCLSPKEKFSCKCPQGYFGKLCETKLQTCLDVLIASKSFPKDDVYLLLRGSNERIIEVYCSFERPNRAWVLIESFSQTSNSIFQKSPFYKNNPQNSKSPTSWGSYRVGLDRMEYLKNKATLFRATCNFPTRTGSLRPDYLLGNLETYFDIFKEEEVSRCMKYLEINIRGHNCTECNAVTIQSNSAHLYIDVTSSPEGNSCPGHFNVSDAVSNEDNFGYYNNYNTESECAKSVESTTQWWFGQEK